MRTIRRFLTFLLVLAVIVGGAMWVWAGRQPAPTVEFRQPERFIGRSSELSLMVEAPAGRLTRLEVVLEQGERTFPVYSLAQPTQPSEGAQDAADRLYVMRPIGKQAIPDLQEGPARLVVRAARPVLFDLRERSVEATREVQVRLTPPQVSVVSTFHYVNLGGAEFVVYRAAPDDVESGVRVGDRTYPGYPGSAVGAADPMLRVAFFALSYDQTVDTPISVFATDPAGNTTEAPLEHMAFPKSFVRSTVPVDSWVARVVPPIVANTTDMQLSSDPKDVVPTFVQINSEMRRRNAETIAGLAKQSKAEMMWREPFQPLGNASIEARFADFRTYTFEGKEIDRQVHLGFDLAVTQQVPILAAQRGVVVHAAYLGIYGNCVIIDHGLGVQTLYGHLSSIGVKAGDTVEKGQTLGRSGTTGLAAGDHLHFTVLVGGTPVNPIEWWDSKWINDRVLRKIREAGGNVT